MILKEFDENYNYNYPELHRQRVIDCLEKKKSAIDDNFLNEYLFMSNKTELNPLKKDTDTQTEKSDTKLKDNLKTEIIFNDTQTEMSPKISNTIPVVSLLGTPEIIESGETPTQTPRRKKKNQKLQTDIQSLSERPNQSIISTQTDLQSLRERPTQTDVQTLRERPTQTDVQTLRERPTGEIPTQTNQLTRDPEVTDVSWFDFNIDNIQRARDNIETSNINEIEEIPPQKPIKTKPIKDRYMDWYVPGIDPEEFRKTTEIEPSRRVLFTSNTDRDPPSPKKVIKDCKEERKERLKKKKTAEALRKKIKLESEPKSDAREMFDRKANQMIVRRLSRLSRNKEIDDESLRKGKDEDKDITPRPNSPASLSSYDSQDFERFKKLTGGKKAKKSKKSKKVIKQKKAIKLKK